MLGGATNPINDKYFSVKDLLEYTGNDIGQVTPLLKVIDTETDETWMRINSFVDSFTEISKQRALNRYVLPEHSRLEFPVEQALEKYTNPKKYGLPGPSKGTDWTDLEKLRVEVVRLSNDIEEVFENLNSDLGAAIEDIEVTSVVLRGLEWLNELNTKLTQKMTNLTTYIFGLDSFQFDDLVKGLMEDGAFNSSEDQGTPRAQQEVARAASAAPQGSSSSSSRRRGRPRGRSGSRSRSSSRPRSRRGSRSGSSSRSRSRRGSRSGSSSRSRSRRGSRSRSRSRPRSQSSSSGMGSLERRLAALQQMENVSPVAPRREGSSEELERRFNELQNEGVRRSLFQ
jgi:hypothetical protein